MNYFMDLFKAPSTLLPPIPVVFHKVVYPLMNEWLTQHPLEEEIRTTLFAFMTGKSLGPDGFTSEFFRKLWPEVRLDVLQCVKQFFKGKPILQSSNHTFITLIPKIPTAIDMGDFILQLDV